MRFPTIPVQYCNRMKPVNFTTTILGLALISTGLSMHEARAASYVSETEIELIANGDFDGDGRADLVIVDKGSGKYRLGYQQAAGSFTWVPFRASGIKDVTSLAVGPVLAAGKDAILLTSADGNQVALIEAASSSSPATPVPVAFTALGPGAPVIVDIGGAGNTPLADVIIGSLYATPPKAILFRNDAGKLSQLAEVSLPGAPAHSRKVALKAGSPELVAFCVNEEAKDSFRIEDYSSGKPVSVASATDLPSGSDYVVGHFGGRPLPEFVFFKLGESNLVVRPLEESAPGKYAFGPAQTIDLPDTLRVLAAVPAGKAAKLVLSFGKGEKGGLYDFDGKKAPTLAQDIPNKAGDLCFAAAAFDGGFLMLSAPQIGGKYSTKYALYLAEGDNYTAKTTGSLATLEESDEGTIPLIHQLVTDRLDVKTEAEMKPYTNTISGTPVKYVMMPIPGGEFMMGSPDAQSGRKPDEGPQHKVKIEPFWMGKFELTWNEYELFMFPDDEKRYRSNIKTDPYVDKVSDAVSRPSKPYTEMSFGMGKDGYPAIAMTQHAANKYCQWLSAKTGQFYRLPTEAEWEYACRAGTTTAYSFGDDPKQLVDYGWFGKNSDWKYQKVGKKKPNPWGLHDMHGNVLEWCLDQYSPDYYKEVVDKAILNPWNKATQPYPHSARGGCWDDDEVTALRSAARRGSERTWKMTDPQLPKSFWYLSDAQWIGFRLVRPLKVSSPEEMKKYWISGVEKD